jgi:hypothetical protein
VRACGHGLRRCLAALLRLAAVAGDPFGRGPYAARDLPRRQVLVMQASGVFGSMSWMSKELAGDSALSR